MTVPFAISIFVGFFSLIGALIITGGTRTGVMELVGDAVKDHIITTGRKNDVVVLGMASLGCVANRLWAGRR